MEDSDDEGSGHSDFYLVEPPRIDYHSEKTDDKKLETKIEQERIFDPIDPDNFKFFTVSDNCLDKVASNPDKVYERIGITPDRKTVRLLAYEKRAA